MMYMMVSHELEYTKYRIKNKINSAPPARTRARAHTRRIAYIGPVTPPPAPRLIAHASRTRMASSLFSAAKGLLLLPFLPVVLMRRAVCRKEKDPEAAGSSSPTPLAANPRHGNGEGAFDDGGGGWQSASKSMPVRRVASGGSDGSVSRFQTVRGGMETKGSSDEASAAAADLAVGGLGRGDGYSGGDADGWSSSTLRRRRPRDYSFSETSELAFNDGDEFSASTPTGCDNDRPGGSSSNRDAMTPTPPLSRPNSDFDESMNTSGGANPMPADPRFSRERQQSIERAQRFIRSDSGGDRDVMEKLLLADRTHVWLKKL